MSFIHKIVHSFRKQNDEGEDKWTLNFLAVKQLTTFDRAVMVYQIRNKLCLENLWNEFHLRSHYSRYNTRFCRNIQISKYNLEYEKKDFHTQH